MSVFDNQTDKTDEDTLTSLVGEGKKFKTLDDLAKGKQESDRYIEELKAKLAAAEEKLAKSVTTDDILKQLKEGQTQKAQTVTETTFTESDLETLLERKISEREKRQTAKEKLASVEKTVIEALGDKAKEYIQKKSEQLGVSIVRMQELAAESPSAFITLIGLDKTDNKTTGTSMTVSTQKIGNTGPSPSDVRDFKWYQKLRKEDPRRYHSSEVQRAMFEDRQRLGVDKFGV